MVTMGLVSVGLGWPLASPRREGGRHLKSGEGLAPRLPFLWVHEDGTRTDVEMQTKNRGATERRALYHWTRLYRDGLSRGEELDDLSPCRVFFFLSFTLFESRRRLHSKFLLLEAHEHHT